MSTATAYGGINPRSTVPINKVILNQLFNKFPKSYAKSELINTFTRDQYFSLS